MVDDRGKFIYISPEELQAVATFVQRRGRISIAELAVESNKLVNLKEVIDQDESDEKASNDCDVADA